MSEAAERVRDLEPEDVFRSAAEFFDRRDPDPERDMAHPPAKTVIWYDQETPLFACEAHARYLQSLRWEGDGETEDHEAVREEAHRRLWEEVPPCDACSGRVREKTGGWA